MARVKGRVPVTFSISPDVLAVVDAHAETVGLDRYDVMRLAIAEGVMALRFKHELVMDSSGKYMKLFSDALSGDTDAAEQLELIQTVVADGLERSVPGGPSKLKPRRKVKDDGL